MLRCKPVWAPSEIRGLLVKFGGPWLVFVLRSGRLRMLATERCRSWLVRTDICRHAGRLDLSLLIGDRRSHAVASRKCVEVEIPWFVNRICQ
jgi:hypothetical protein